MYDHLKKLCEYHSQDFDLLFVRPTDPIDLYCENCDAEAQTALLQEMCDFYREVQSGTKAHKDLVTMGLEYTPGDRETFDWFTSAIGYLRTKIGGKGAGIV